ncbi:MAG TPA: hypothetical protein VKA08_14620 [Balneolales bacterium]|jgi:hypothetical protein|nr:hypothetical protein [Balneolales bacterium]
MKRKDFLYFICAPAFGAVGLTFLSKISDAREIGKYPILNDSINLDSAARVGQAYIKQGGPELREVQEKANQLQKKFDFTGSSNSKKELEMLNLSIRSDFKNGKTVLFHNWVLSQTEIAFCVFAYQNKYSFG